MISFEIIIFKNLFISYTEIKREEKKRKRSLIIIIKNDLNLKCVFIEIYVNIIDFFDISNKVNFNRWLTKINDREKRRTIW